MKASIFFTAVLSLLLMVILFPTCKDDPVIPPDPDPIPIPVTIPIEEYNVVGYRLVLDSIMALGIGDGGDGHSEFFGYIKVTPKYDAAYVFTEEDFEKKEDVLMWYRQNNKWVRINSGESLPVGSYCDFLFNKDHLGKASIEIESWFFEHDGNDHPWSVFLNKNDHDFELQIETPIPIEDILTSKDYTWEYSLPDFPGNHDVQIKYHFEKILTNEDYIYPEGYGPDQEFNITNELFPTPRPAAYSAGIPTSDRVVVAQSPVRKLYLIPAKVKTGNDNLFWYPDLSVFSNQTASVTKVKFISDGTPCTPTFEPLNLDDPDHDKDPQCLVHWGNISNDALYMMEDPIDGPKIEKTPMIQIVQYWQPLKIWRMPAGASKSFTVETTKGWEKEEGSEIGVTLSYSCGFFGFGDFSAEMSSTFSYSFSSFESETLSETFSYSAPDDKNVIYIIWQQVSEFRLVGTDGKIFQDPNYEFRSMTVARTRSDELIEEAYLFDAN
jgi:hypothetical protein